MIVSADRPEAPMARAADDSSADGGDAFSNLLWRQPDAGTSGSRTADQGTGPAKPGTPPVKPSAPKGLVEGGVTNLQEAARAPSMQPPVADAAAVIEAEPVVTPEPVAPTMPTLIEAVLLSEGRYEAVPSTNAAPEVEDTDEADDKTVDTDEPKAETANTTGNAAATPVAVPTLSVAPAYGINDGLIRRAQRAANVASAVTVLTVRPATVEHELTPERVQLDQAAPSRAGSPTAALPQPEGADPRYGRFTDILTSVRAGAADGPVVPMNLGKARFDVATQAIVHSNVEARDHVAPAVGEMLLRADVAAIVGNGGAPTGAAGHTAATPTPASTETLITTRADLFVRDLAHGIAHDFKAGNRWLDIRLDPAELGRIDVRLTIDAKGQVQAVIAADNPSTYDLLRRESGSLVAALRDAGVQTDADSLRFDLRSDLNRDGQRQGWGPQDQTDDELAEAVDTVGARPAVTRGHLI